MSTGDVPRVQTRLTAWHVGRQGEVAGGMTQVVNGYLAWRFEKFGVRVISSRDGSFGIRALMIFVRAVGQVLGLKDPRRNIVVVHLSQGGSFVREGVLLRLAHFRGFHTIAHLHGSSFGEFARRRSHLVRWVLQASSRVVVLSDAAVISASRFVQTSRISLIANAVPSGNPKPKERLIVFGGSVSPRKGVDVLGAAWSLVGPGSGWRLVIAGPVLHPASVPSDLPGVQVLGAIPHSQLMNLLDRSSIAVLPSRDEAMPMFILEALARSNCVISTPIGGIPTVLGEGRGILVPVGDISALASALEYAMQNEAMRTSIALAGHLAFDAGYSARAVYPQVEQLWFEVLTEEGPRVC